MSVQTELDRLNAAKNSLKTAIESKGVAVPDSTKLDGYSALVDQISSGGDSNVVVVDIPELNSNNTQVTLTDEQIKLLSSDKNVVYLRPASGLLLQRIMKAENSLSFSGPSFMQYDDNVLMLVETVGIVIPTRLASYVLINSLAVIPPESNGTDKNKIFTVGDDNFPMWSDPTCPVATSSDNGKFLQVVNGVPKWSSLPIYNGEVE